MNERRKDLNCRDNCPFTGRTNVTLRPCVTKIEAKVEICFKNINNHFFERGIENPIYTTVPENLPKRIEVFEDNRKIAIVANGVVAFVKTLF